MYGCLVINTALGEAFELRAPGGWKLIHSTNVPLARGRSDGKLRSDRPAKLTTLAGQFAIADWPRETADVIIASRMAPGEVARMFRDALDRRIQ